MSTEPSTERPLERVPAPPSAPPVPPTTSVTHSHHGVRRTDDHAWPARPTPELLAHLAAERSFYERAVAHSRDLQEGLLGEMSALLPETDRSVSWDEGGSVYYTRTPAGKDLEQFCRVTPGDAPDDVLLDLTVEARGSSYAALGVREVSPDGRLLAWSLDTTGDERHELRVRDLTTGADLPGVVPGTGWTAAWSADARWVLYVRADDASRPHQVWRHRVGTDPADDVLVLAEEDERFALEVGATRSGRWLVLRAASRTTAQVWLVPASDPTAAPRPVAPRRAGVEWLVDDAVGPDGVAPDDPADGHDLLALTNLGWPEFRLVALSSDGSADEPREALAPRPGERLVDLAVLADHVVLQLRRDGAPLLRAHARRGAVVETHGVEIAPDLPAATVALGPEHRWHTGSVLVVEESLVTPPRWSDVELTTGERTLRHATPAPGFVPGRYATERRWVTARDGERVPVTLARRADVPLDGSAPCLLHGYGAYEVPLDPEWDPALVPLLDRGVVVALAHVRGGGEGGRRWWEAGRLDRKRTTFEDYLDVAEALADGVVDGGRLVTRGLSAGGLLQGAVLSRAPGRWCGVVAEVPFVDVVTTMLDPTIPLTVNEWEEWGDPRRPEDFAWLLAYSPYDNPPPPGGRPDVLVTGALHDPRVLVREPAKWVARLRATDPAWGPRCLFRVELGEGAHTGPAGRYARLAYEAEVLAWALERLAPDRDATVGRDHT